MPSRLTERRLDRPKAGTKATTSGTASPRHRRRRFASAKRELFVVVVAGIGIVGVVLDVVVVVVTPRPSCPALLG